MKKKILFILLVIASIALVYKYTAQESATTILRKKHTTFLKKHEFSKRKNISKKERKSQGLPPNAYFEQEYLNEINPNTGRTHKENVFKLQGDLQNQRLAQRVPGGNSESWVERGPNNVGGRTRAVIFDPNDASQETVFAGGVSGGLWKNTNISNPNSTWTQVGISENLAVSCIAIDPNDSNIWYVGTGESHTAGEANGNGVWKSTDGGATWSHLFGGVTGPSVYEANSTFTVNTPASIAGNYVSVLATVFGGNLSTAVTGDLALADDGTDPNDDACTDLTNGAAISGKIAVIRRGDCPFVEKVKRAQDVGALAVVIVNNVAGDPIPMGGDDATITIPSVMVSMSDGNAMIAEIANGVEVTLSSGGLGFEVLPGIQHINDIAIRDNNGSSEVFVAVGDTFYSDGTPSVILGSNDMGIYKSIDGSSFSKLSFPTAADGSRYEPNNIKIAADNSLYVSTNSGIGISGGGGAILHSTDGSTFTLKHTITDGLRTEIALSPTNANIIYVLAQLSGGAPVGMYKTTDNFATVSSLPLPNDVDSGIPANDFTRGQAGYDLLLKIDPNNENVLYVGGIDLFKSPNGGTIWSQISKWSNNNSLASLNVSLVHADQHGLAFSSSSRMVFGTDGGVYFSNDSGTSIGERNSGYNTAQFYTVGVAPTAAFSGDYFIAGAQDNGTQLFSNANTSGTSSTSKAAGGDGAYSFFDEDGTDKYYISNYVYNGSIKLFDYNSGSSRTINSESASNGGFINQEELDSNLNILYSNYSSGSNYIIKRYANLLFGTVSKTNLTNNLMDAEPSAMKVSPYTTNETTLLVGLKNGKVLKVNKANLFSFAMVWTEITGSNFVGTVSDIEFGTSEDEIFVTMHNYGVKSIWYSNNGGTTWQDKEGDFPDIPVKTILQNPLRTEEVIIGTDLGVWKTNNFTDASPNWVQSYNGMSNVKVTDLDVRDDNMVFAATYGRGVFSGQFTAEVASVKDVVLDTKEFTIYPTISDGNFTVFAKKLLGNSQLQIFDVRGKEVHKQKIDFSSQEKQVVSVNLKVGVYIVNLIDSENKKSSRKIIIK